MRTIDQKNFEFVINTLEKYLIDKDMNFLKEFSSFISGAPIMVLNNGLIQSVAFWDAKKEKNEKFEIILKLIKEFLSIDSSLIDYLTNLKQEKYIEIVEKILTILEYAKRYAQMIKP